MIRIHLENPEDAPLPEALLERAVRLVLEREGVEEAEISLIFLPDAPIQELNRRWLDHSWVPDVLTFPLHEPGEPPLGDVYIGVEEAARQAERVGVTRDEELVRLAVHGALHLLGYDHPEAVDERATSEQYRIQEDVVTEVMSRRGNGAP